MANTLYDTGRNAFLNAGINFTTDTIKMALVSNGYTPVTTADQYLTTISSFIVGTPQVLTSKATTAGVAACANITFSAVAVGSTVTYLVIYKDTGTASTSQLIAILDTATGLPIVTNGGDITLTIDSGSSRLFKL